MFEFPVQQLFRQGSGTAFWKQYQEEQLLADFLWELVENGIDEGLSLRL